MVCCSPERGVPGACWSCVQKGVTPPLPLPCPPSEALAPPSLADHSPRHLWTQSLSPYLSSAPPHMTTKISSRVKRPWGAPRHPDVQPLSFPFCARHRASRVIQASCPCSSGSEHPSCPLGSHSSHAPGIIQQMCLTCSAPKPSLWPPQVFVHLGTSIRLGRPTRGLETSVGWA